MHRKKIWIAALVFSNEISGFQNVTQRSSGRFSYSVFHPLQCRWTPLAPSSATVFFTFELHFNYEIRREKEKTRKLKAQKDREREREHMNDQTNQRIIGIIYTQLPIYAVNLLYVCVCVFFFLSSAVVVVVFASSWNFNHFYCGKCKRVGLMWLCMCVCMPKQMDWMKFLFHFDRWIQVC